MVKFLSAQSSSKSTLKNHIYTPSWLLKSWHFGKFCHWPLLCTLNSVLCVAKWEISNILFQFASLVMKAMAFWEIVPLALLCALNYVLCMAKWEISNFSFFSLACWPLKS